jgi:signal transduction histidine kinase
VHKDLEQHLPLLIEELSNNDTSISMADRWASVLEKFFTESILENAEGRIDKCETSPDHQTLLVPAITPNRIYRLVTSSQGGFNDNDAQLADALLKLTRQFMSVQEAIEKGASEERQRIARDLHDDVAARILTLIHQIRDQQTINLARSILKSLRNAIYTLDNKSTARILDALTDIRAELQERLNTIGMQLFWNQPSNLDNLTFTPRQHINLHRILHETTTNVIRHADAQFVTIDIDVDEDKMRLLVCDNGRGFDMDACIPGKGINNIKNRVQELSGQVSWTDNAEGGSGCCLDICFPISLTKAAAQRA